MSDKLVVLRLYKELLRESSKFKSYYYKNYFTRKTKSQFRKHINADENTAAQLLKKSEDMLSMLKRQTMITNAYDSSRLVIEQPDDSKTRDESANSR